MRNQWLSSEAISARPGRIIELLDRQFTVVEPWRDFGVSGVNQRPVLLRWQVGVKGIVCAIVFDTHQGWQVKVEYLDYPLGMAPDEVWPDIPLQEFLYCCEPVEATRWPDANMEAANDSDVF
jgi:hypothetical protein